jgi:pilus assembly protein CpaE
VATVILCDSDEQFLSSLQALLERQRPDAELAQVRTAADAIDLAARKDTAVVVLGPSVPVDLALAAGERLGQTRPQTLVVMVTQRLTTELLHRALRAGLKDVVASETTTYGEVSEAIEDAYEAAMGSRASEPGSAEERVMPQRRARTLTVFSTKGGVGKTVIASNVAVALSKRPGTRVVLVDLDLTFGDAGVILKLEPRHTIYDAARAADRLDTQMLRGFLTPHSSGLNVLLAPKSPDQAESVTTARLAAIIELLQGMFDYVVIDTAGSFEETVLTAIDKSDDVLAVATMDMPSVKNTMLSLRKLRQLGYGDNLVKLVLNRADSKVFLETGDVERGIGGRIAAEVPSDRLVPRSVNKGVPVVLEAPRSGVARSLMKVAELVVNHTEK